MILQGQLEVFVEGSCVRPFCSRFLCDKGSSSPFSDESHCYFGLWAEGAQIGNILANKQGFIGTTDPRTEHRIMQWNLTGLCGATWAEELINVWGPVGVICTFVDIVSSQNWSSHCSKHRAKVLLNTNTLCTKDWGAFTDRMNGSVIFAFAPLACTLNTQHTMTVSQI